MGANDPLLGIPYRLVVPVAAAIEIVLAMILLVQATRRLGAGLLACFAANLLLYRFALATVGGTVAPCPCLGSLVDWWPALEKWQFPVLFGLAAFWLAGGLRVLLPKATHKP